MRIHGALTTAVFALVLLPGCGQDSGVSPTRDLYGATTAGTLCRWLVDNGAVGESLKKDFAGVYLVASSQRQGTTSTFAVIQASGDCGARPFVRLEASSSYVSRHAVGYHLFDDTTLSLAWSGNGSTLRLEREFRSGWEGTPPSLSAEVSGIGDLLLSSVREEPSGGLMLGFRANCAHRTRGIPLSQAVPWPILGRNPESSVLPIPSRPSGTFSLDFTLELAVAPRGRFALRPVGKRDPDDLFQGFEKVESYP